MDMTVCTTSSQVCEYGYDPATKTLAIRFKSGGLYHYEAVPQETFDGLKGAESVGKFLGAEIKGKFKYERVEPGGLGKIKDGRQA